MTKSNSKWWGHEIHKNSIKSYKFLCNNNIQWLPEKKDMLRETSWGHRDTGIPKTLRWNEYCFLSSLRNQWWQMNIRLLLIKSEVNRSYFSSSSYKISILFWSLPVKDRMLICPPVPLSMCFCQHFGLAPFKVQSILPEFSYYSFKCFDLQILIPWKQYQLWTVFVVS